MWSSPEDFDFPVRVGGLRLRNPVVAASGTYGYGLEYEEFGDPSLLGAVIPKSLTVSPRPGFPAPRVVMLPDPGSMRNAVGVANPGIARWAETILPSMCAKNVTVIASLWGADAEELVRGAEILSRYPGPAGWEINLSCPNTEHPDVLVSHDPYRAGDVCAAIRRLAPQAIGVWAKLSPDAPSTVDVGLACHESGADALTISNTLSTPEGIRQRSPALGRGPGGISGALLRQYVRPLVEKFGSVYPDIDVVACGGVLSSRSALDYLQLGARAVQVGTASLYDPRACHKIARGVVKALRSAGGG